jgi:hypothetical protein
MTIASPDTAIWAGFSGQAWLRPAALEVRTVDVTNVEPCPGEAPHVVVVTSDASGWVQARLAAERRSDAG